MEEVVESPATTAEMGVPPPSAVSLPEFANKDAVDCHALVPWSAKWYVACVKLDKAMVHAMLDTGGHALVVDERIAHDMGLDVMPASAGDCGNC